MAAFLSRGFLGEPGQSPIVLTGGKDREKEDGIVGDAVVAAGLVVLHRFAGRGRGATQISGLGNWPGVGECLDFPDEQFDDYSFKMEGDLEGCVYVFVETATCSPSGTYRETGKEYYVFTGGDLGLSGTFITSYRFTGKFEVCPLEDPFAAEIFGRCQHPIIEGSGTEDFLDVTGRIDFKDDIEVGDFPYRGHIRW